MKADELTVAGLYWWRDEAEWFRDGGVWTVVEYDGDGGFSLIGTEIPRVAVELPGEFAGPFDGPPA